VRDRTAEPSAGSGEEHTRSRDREVWFGHGTSLLRRPPSGFGDFGPGIGEDRRRDVQPDVSARWTGFRG
jgi:hypothetical protein